VVPVLLACFATVAFRRRSAAAVRFAHVDVLAEVAPAPPLLRRALPGVLVCVALASMAVGLAGPYRLEDVESQRRKVVLAFDVSNSMLADDVEPNRLEVARSAATEFIESVPDDVDVGLVLFSRSVVLSRPPTPDRDEVIRALTNAELSGGTAIGEAVFSALALLESTSTNSGDGPTTTAGTQRADSRPAGVVVVLSDGETTAGRPDDEAARAAAEANVQVSTIAFGTPSGVVVLPDTGESQAVPYQPEALARIAEATGGIAAEASDAGALAAVFDDLEASVTTERRPVHYSSWVFAASFGLLSASAALSLRWLRRLG
jgi:Ca-activated chloride channel family protein